MKPEIWVLLVDETEHWISERVLEEVDRLIGVYIYDASRVIHIASMTGSFECRFIETAAHGKNDDGVHQTISDEVYEIISEGNIYAEEWYYFSEHDIDALLVLKEGQALPEGVKMAKLHYWTPNEEELGHLEDGSDDVHWAAMEAAFESVRCNAVY